MTAPAQCDEVALAPPRTLAEANTEIEAIVPVSTRALCSSLVLVAQRDSPFPMPEKLTDVPSFSGSPRERLSLYSHCSDVTLNIRLDLPVRADDSYRVNSGVAGEGKTGPVNCLNPR